MNFHEPALLHILQYLICHNPKLLRYLERIAVRVFFQIFLDIVKVAFIQPFAGFTAICPDTRLKDGMTVFTDICVHFGFSFLFTFLQPL